MAYKSLYSGGKYIGKKTYHGLSSKGFSLNWFFVIAVSVYFYFKGKKKSGQADTFFDPNKVDPNKYSITVEEAIIKAKVLRNAFNWRSVFLYFGGTDLDAVESVVNNINAYDLGLIHSHFGSPKYLIAGDGPNLGTPKDLKGWIKEEIDRDEPVFIRLQKLYRVIGIYL